MTSRQMKTPATSCQTRRGGNAKHSRPDDTPATVSNAEFIANAFAGCGTDETPWIAGFPGDVAMAAHSVWFGAKALPLPRFVRDTHNNYVCVSSFRRGPDSQFRRRKDCWSGLWLVLLDDIGSKIDEKHALRIEPTALVETSPGNLQGWLFLNRPERDAARAEALINGLIAARASDPGAGSVTRYGRLPVGINGKAKYTDKRGQPWIQRVRTWEPARRYTVEDIATAYGIDLATAVRPKTQRKRAEAEHDTDNNYLAILEGAGLYLEAARGLEGAHRIICPWYRSHTDEGTTGTMYFAPSEENSYRGGFKCHHGHCKDRTIADLDHFMSRLLAGGAA